MEKMKSPRASQHLGEMSLRAVRISDHPAHWVTVRTLEHVAGHFLFFLPLAFKNLSVYLKYLATCLSLHGPTCVLSIKQFASHLFLLADSEYCISGLPTMPLTYRVSSFVITEVLRGLFLLLF